MKVLLLLTLAAVGQCALLGSKKCTYGPSYWCSHLHHAKECNAVQHCMSTVWKKQNVDMIGSTETCFDVIKVLDIVRHSSDAEFMEQWAVGCTGMPLEKRQMCKELTVDDMNEVYKLLKSDLSSRQVAAALKLCGGFDDTVPHPQQGQVSGDYCKDCVNFLSDLRDLFNSSEGQVETMMKGLICTNMGPLQSLCDQLVDQYASTLFNFMVQELNPEMICQALRLCANETRADLMKSLKEMMTKFGGMECDLCKTLTEDAQRALTDTTFQNDVFAFLKAKVCDRLGSFGNQCKNYIDSFGPLLFQVLVSEMDPQTVCQTLHVCSSQAPGSFQYMVAKHQLGSAECDTCKTVVQDVQNELKDPTVQTDILGFLKDNVCSLLGSFAGQCNTYVDSYGPVVFQFVVAELDPQGVCQALHVCSNQTHPDLMNYLLAKRQRSGATCDVCKSLVQDVQNELKDPTVQNAILTFLKDDVCSRLGSFADQCNTYVKSYGPVVFEILVAELDPQDVCQALHLCSNQTRPDLMKYILAKKRMNGVECDLCKSLAQEVQSLLQDTSVQNSVLTFLKNDVCTILGSFSGQCQSYVDTYGPAAFQILVAELDPQTICQTIGICNAPASSKLTHVHLGSPMGTVQILPPQKKVESVVTCALCKELVAEVKKLIDDKGKAEAKQALEDLCKKLPAELSGDCKLFVEIYGDEIIDLLFEELSPDLVCTKIHVCPSSAFLQAVRLQLAVKSEKCDVCMDVIDFVKKEVNSSEARTFETNMLDKICTDVLTKYGWMCGWFVNKYAPAIINMFEEKADPAKICSVMELCGKAPSPAESHPLVFQPMLELQSARPHLLGTKECLYGPSFWCASERNAKLCNAVEECKRMKEMENKLIN